MSLSMVLLFDIVKLAVLSEASGSSSKLFVFKGVASEKKLRFISL